jgi:hypothetical protein
MAFAWLSSVPPCEQDQEWGVGSRSPPPSQDLSGDARAAHEDATGDDTVVQYTVKIEKEE